MIRGWEQEGKAVGDSFPRREFLCSAVRAGLVALAGPVLAMGNVAGVRGAVRADSYGRGKFALVLNGAFAGFLDGVDGGDITASVSQVWDGTTMRKHVSGQHVTPMRIHSGIPLNPNLAGWIKSSIEPSGKFEPRSGLVLECDSTYKVIARRSFNNARITRVEFPAADKSLTNSAGLAVTFHPDSVGLQLRAGEALQSTSSLAKRWLSPNFRLSIPGLERATPYVSKVEVISVSRDLSTASSSKFGTTSSYSTTTPPVDVGALRVKVPNAQVVPFLEWHQQFVVMGKIEERPGTLEYLSADLSTVLRLNLLNLGITKVTRGPVTDAVPYSEVEMYCEAMTCDFMG